MVEERRGLLGAEVAVRAGELDDVGEQHRHLAVLGGERGRDPPADQALHDRLGQVGREHPERAHHRVERDRRLVDLAQPRAAQRREIVEVEGADRARRRRQLRDRTADPAAEPDRRERGREQASEAEPERQQQTLELEVDRLGREIAADQPARVHRRLEALVEKQVRVSPSRFQWPGDLALQPAVLPALAPDPEQHRIADLGDPAAAAASGPRPGKFERERAVREHEVALVEDERVLAELGLEAGDELRQRRHGDGRDDHAPDLAVDHQGAPQVDQGHALVLDVDRRAPVGAALRAAPAPARSPAPGRLVAPVGDLRAPARGPPGARPSASPDGSK